MNTNSMNGPKILAALLLVGITSGSASMLIKVIVRDISPVDLVAGRLAMAVVPLVVLMIIRHIRPDLTPRALAGVAVLAILDSVLPYTLVAWAAVRIDSAIAALLISTMPLFTTLFASMRFRDERLTVVGATGMGLGFLGVVVLGGHDLLQAGGSAAGIVAVVLASASYAGGAVFARPLMKTGNPVALTGMKLMLATVMVMPLIVMRGGIAAYINMSPEGLLSLLALGVGSTGLSRIVYLWIIGAAGSVKASLVTYLVPVIGVALGVTILGESLGPNAFAGSALIVLGAGLVMYGPQVAPSISRTALKRLPVHRLRVVYSRVPIR